MHFGRVESDKGMDLGLPPVGARTEAYLKLGHGGRGLIYCGAPIWACKDWVPELYPERAKPSEYLHYYAQRYSMVELNSSFYHLPTREQARVWCLQTGPEFRFLPKVPKELSHKLTAGWDKDLLRSYLFVMQEFGEKHGLSFLQLPEWFTLKDFPALEKFLDAMGSEFKLAIEFRHASFFSGSTLIDPLVNFLYRRGLSAVITDTPGERSVLHTSLMAPQVLVRFQGVFPSLQDEKRLRAWMDRLIEWMHAGMDVAYVAIHQARNGAIPGTVDYALRYLFERNFPRIVRPEAEKDDENALILH